MEKEKKGKNSKSFQIQQFISVENPFSKFEYLSTLLGKLIIFLLCSQNGDQNFLNLSGYFSQFVIFNIIYDELCDVIVHKIDI